MDGAKYGRVVNGVWQDARPPNRDYVISAKNFFFFGCNLSLDTVEAITARMNVGTVFMYNDGGLDGLTQLFTDVDGAEAAAKSVLGAGGDNRTEAQSRAQDSFNKRRPLTDGDRFWLKGGRRRRNERDRGREPTKPCVGCPPERKPKPNDKPGRHKPGPYK